MEEGGGDAEYACCPSVGVHVFDSSDVLLRKVAQQVSEVHVKHSISETVSVPRVTSRCNLNLVSAHDGSWHVSTAAQTRSCTYADWGQRQGNAAVKAARTSVRTGFVVHVKWGAAGPPCRWLWLNSR